MKKITLYLVLTIFISCASNSSQKFDIPSWYLNPNVIDESNNLSQHIGIGSGENKDEAMIFALGEALRSIKLTKPAQTIKEIEKDGEKVLESAAQSLNSYEFGLITYKSSLKDYQLAGSKETYDSSEMTSILTLKGSNPIIIKSHLSATGLGADAKSERFFEIIPENQDLIPLYDELVKNGISVVKNEKIGDIYFIAISIDGSNPERFNHN